MATKSPVKEPPAETTQSKPALSSPIPAASAAATAATVATPPVKPETPTTTPRPLPLPPSSDVDVIHVPSYSRWFSWNDIHDCEVRFLPEFFDSRSPSKNPRVYKYFRDSIIRHFRENTPRKITFTDVRRTLVGDVGSIRRVFDFLEAWGLINYSASALNKPLKWEDKETKAGAAAASLGGSGDVGGASVESSAPNRETTKRYCSGCKSVCTIACFACDKYDLTLCARCYVRGNYRVGVSSSDFTRVEISEEMKTDWTDKETLQLLEAVMRYGDDWRKVAQLVGGRSERDCITHFIKLPFGEEFVGYPDSGDNQIKDPSNAECGLESIGSSSPSKRMRLTPLADASNPIMAQAAFLSTLAGVEIAEAAAQATVATLSEVGYGASKGSRGSLTRKTRQQEANVASNGDTTPNALERASVAANSLLEQEELDVEKAVSGITEVQMKEIQDKIVHFEELDLQMEKEWQQLEQMKNLLFVDQLTLLFHKNSAKSGERMEENVTN